MSRVHHAELHILCGLGVHRPGIPLLTHTYIERERARERESNFEFVKFAILYIVSLIKHYMPRAGREVYFPR